jgi:hypothetical protein
VDFIIVHFVVNANFVENFPSSVLKLQRDIRITICVLILSQEYILTLQQVHITLKLLLLNLQIIQRFLHRHHQYFIKSILQRVLLKLVDSLRTLILLDFPRKHLSLRDFLFFIGKSLRLNDLI